MAIDKGDKNPQPSQKEGKPKSFMYSLDDADAAIRREVEQETRNGLGLNFQHQAETPSYLGSDLNSGAGTINLRSSNSSMFTQADYSSGVYKPSYPYPSPTLHSVDIPHINELATPVKVVNVIHSHTPSDSSTLPPFSEPGIPPIPPSPQLRSSIPLVVKPDPSPDPLQRTWKPVQTDTLQRYSDKSPSVSADDDTINSVKITQAIKQNELLNSLLSRNQEARPGSSVDFSSVKPKRPSRFASQFARFLPKDVPSKQQASDGTEKRSWLPGSEAHRESLDRDVEMGFEIQAHDMLYNTSNSRAEEEGMSDDLSFGLPVVYRPNAMQTLTTQASMQEQENEQISPQETPQETPQEAKPLDLQGASEEKLGEEGRSNVETTVEQMNKSGENGGGKEGEEGQRAKAERDLQRGESAGSNQQVEDGQNGLQKEPNGEKEEREEREGKGEYGEEQAEEGQEYQNQNQPLQDEQQQQQQQQYLDEEEQYQEEQHYLDEQQQYQDEQQQYHDEQQQYHDEQQYLEEEPQYQDEQQYLDEQQQYQDEHYQDEEPQYQDELPQYQDEHYQDEQQLQYQDEQQLHYQDEQQLHYQNEQGLQYQDEQQLQYQDEQGLQYQDEQPQYHDEEYLDEQYQEEQPSHYQYDQPSYQDDQPPYQDEPLNTQEDDSPEKPTSQGYFDSPLSQEAAYRFSQENHQYQEPLDAPFSPETDPSEQPSRSVSDVSSSKLSFPLNVTTELSPILVTAARLGDRIESHLASNRPSEDFSRPSIAQRIEMHQEKEEISAIKNLLDQSERSADCKPSLPAYHPVHSSLSTPIKRPLIPPATQPAPIPSLSSAPLPPPAPSAPSIPGVSSSPQVLPAPSLGVISSLESLNVPQKYIQRIYDSSKKYTEYDLIVERTKAQEQALLELKTARAVIEKQFEAVEEELVGAIAKPDE